MIFRISTNVFLGCHMFEGELQVLVGLYDFFLQVFFDGPVLYKWTV